MITVALAGLALASAVHAPPTERILAVDGYVVAHATGGAWRAPADGFAHNHPAATFHPFGLGTAGGTAPTSRFEFDENQSGTTLTSGASGALLAGSMPRAPRRVRTQGAGPAYEAACRRFLLRHGIRVARARVTRVLRVDLDGDGTDETLVEATNGEIANAAKMGTYSLVLLRALRGGQVVETALELSPSPPGGAMVVGRVRAVADLDGDGRMEVLVTESGIDQLGAILWGYRAGRTTKLVENGIEV